jgi:hypothetical protein
MRWPWQKNRSGSEPEGSSPRQRWDRTPHGLDAITGIKPKVERSDDDSPGEVYPDEIDPAWADRPDEASGQSDRAETADPIDEADRGEQPPSGDSPG